MKKNSIRFWKLEVRYRIMKIETFDDFKMERFKQIPSKIAD